MPGLEPAREAEYPPPSFGEVEVVVDVRIEKGLLVVVRQRIGLLGHSLRFVGPQRVDQFPLEAGKMRS